MQRQLDNGKGIFLLWLNWLLGSGLVTMLILLSLWVRPLYMPFVAFGFQLVLFILIRHNRSRRLPVCYVYPFVISRALFWSGTVMLAINLCYSHWFVDRIFNPEEINPDIPFITVLIVMPLTAIISLWAHTHRKTLSFCRDCKMRHGTPAERGFLGILFTREGQYQIFVSTVMSSVIAICAWGYYGLTYVNSSLSSPDRFVFFWAPALVWVAAAIYFAMRYMGIWSYYHQDFEGSATRHGKSTQVRFFIIADNLICLRSPEVNADKMIPGKSYLDTPVSEFIPRRERISTNDAERIFSNLTDLDNADIRFLYSNISGNADCNIFHFFAFLNREEKADYSRRNPDDRWVTFRDLAQMINAKQLNPLMSAETLKLYTVAMAWKTYDHNGRRRYRIKHYRPTFHIEDVKSWDVNYNDPTWLYVADNNQDTPFYHLRRIWRKYINGVGNYIEELQPNDNI